MTCPSLPNQYTLGTSPVKKNFTTVKGDTFAFVATVQDEDGNAKDFTGYTGSMVIRFDAGDYTEVATMGGAAGTFTIDVSAADSLANFEVGTFEHGCQWTDGSTDVREFLRGTIVVREAFVA